MLPFICIEVSSISIYIFQYKCLFFTTISFISLGNICVVAVVGFHHLRFGPTQKTWKYSQQPIKLFIFVRMSPLQQRDKNRQSLA